MAPGSLENDEKGSAEDEVKEETNIFGNVVSQNVKGRYDS